MSTSVHYVVRNADGHHLLFAGWEDNDETCQNARYQFVDDWMGACAEFDSRAEAERLAAEHGGTVHRITDEAVGLRWRVSFVDSSTFYLYDDNGKFRRQVGGVVSVLGEYVPFTGVGSSRCALEPLATLDEAKAAAEAAVRVAWT